MSTPAKQPIPVTVSSHIYSALMILYPEPYRSEYKGQMIQLYQDVARDSYDRGGVVGIIFWWCTTVLDFISTVIEQRKEEKITMSKPLSIQPIKGTGLGLMCILGGVIYFSGGIWLSIKGLPSDPMAIELTHLLRMMWAGGTTCGLMAMMITGAAEDKFLTRASAWVSGIGLVIIEVDALIALVIHNPVSSFTGSVLPFSNLVQVVPLIGWIVLTVLVIKANRWMGWTKFAPLAMLLAPFVGLLFGQLMGNVFLTVVIMGLGLILLGFAVKTQLDKKRQGKSFAPSFV